MGELLDINIMEVDIKDIAEEELKIEYKQNRENNGKLNILENIKDIDTFCVSKLKECGYKSDFIGELNESKIEEFKKCKEQIEDSYGDFETCIEVLRDYNKKLMTNGIADELGRKGYIKDKILELRKPYEGIIQDNSAVGILNRDFEKSITHPCNIFEAFEILYKEKLKEYDKVCEDFNIVHTEVDRACYGNRYLKKVMPEITDILDREIEKINNKHNEQLIDKDLVHENLVFAIKGARVVDDGCVGYLPGILTSFFEGLNVEKYFSDSWISTDMMTERITNILNDNENLFLYITEAREITNDVKPYQRVEMYKMAEDITNHIYNLLLDIYEDFPELKNKENIENKSEWDEKMIHQLLEENAEDALSVFKEMGYRVEMKNHASINSISNEIGWLQRKKNGL